MNYSLPMYMGLSDAAFAEELPKRVGSWLGPIRVVTKRSAWPLSVLHAERYVAQRLALVGEAAHAMRPIAGQGLNMGLRDVAALAEVIDAHRLGLDVGGPEPLARYERWRRFDNLTLITVTDLLTRLFSNDFGPLKLARDIGMAGGRPDAAAQQIFHAACHGDGRRVAQDDPGGAAVMK